MARLEAAIKLLYYPTPVSVMERIARYVKVQCDRKQAIVDTCAGTGEAARVLADAWGLTFHGVELEAGRAAELADVADVALHGSYSQLQLPPDQGYAVLFLNPPYDYARVDDNTVDRQEVQFLSRSMQLVARDGLVVFVPPSSLLRRTDFRRLVQDNMRNVAFFRFPDEEFAAFGQVVMIANMGGTAYPPDEEDRERAWRKITDLESMPIIGDYEPRKVALGSYSTYSDGRRHEYFRATQADKLKPMMFAVDPADLVPARTGKREGAWATRSWELMTSNTLGDDSAPLVEPRPGHQAMLLAAGALNGVVLGDRYLVKGGSEKQVTREEEKDEGGKVVGATETEKIVSHLSVLDLETGLLDTWEVGKDAEKTAQWFKEYSEELAEAILHSHTPQFDGDVSPYMERLALLSPPGVLPGKTEPCWLDGQVTAACAIAHRWKRHKNVVLSGECGVGKTSVAIISAELSRRGKTVVVCPAHLVPKWVRECEKITGEDCGMVGASIPDVDAFFDDDSKRYLVVSKERAKLGSRWVPRTEEVTRFMSEYVPEEQRHPARMHKKYRQAAYTAHTCPSCGAAVPELTKRVKASCEALLHPRTGTPTRKMSSAWGKPTTEDEALVVCGAPLWTTTPLSTKKRPKAKAAKTDRAQTRAGLEAGFYAGAHGEDPNLAGVVEGEAEYTGYVAGWRLGNQFRRLGPATDPFDGGDDPRAVAAAVKWEVPQQAPIATRRWPLAAYAANRYDRRYSLVVDECHQYAGGETDQSRAIQQLLSAARKTLMMTGTLYGGRASSVFHLLYKCEPSFRAIYRYDEAKRFSQHHGLFTRSYDEKQANSRSGYRRGNGGGKVKEIPGMSPQMIPMLLPYCVFVKLNDIAKDILPPYTEEMVFVDADPRVRQAANRMMQSVKAVMREYPQVLGAYLQACLGYPDRPDQPEEIYAKIYKDKDDPNCDEFTTKLVASAPAIPDAHMPKDAWVLDRVAKEKAEGRRVLVYTTQNNRRDVRGRLKAALEAAGHRVAVLNATVAPDKREAWLDKARAKGFDVLLTNGALVETGLDLLDCPTIVQYGTEYSIHRLRQSSRRSWRLGQSKDVRVFMLAQRGTMQDHATGLITAKLRAAEMVDGDESGGLAQSSGGGGNFLYELASKALAALA